jgi:hypothetical protein
MMNETEIPSTWRNLVWALTRQPEYVKILMEQPLARRAGGHFIRWPGGVGEIRIDPAASDWLYSLLEESAHVILSSPENVITKERFDSLREEIEGGAQTEEEKDQAWDDFYEIQQKWDYELEAKALVGQWMGHARAALGEWASDEKIMAWITDQAYDNESWRFEGMDEGEITKRKSELRSRQAAIENELRELAAKFLRGDKARREHACTKAALLLAEKQLIPLAIEALAAEAREARIVGLKAQIAELEKQIAAIKYPDREPGYRDLSNRVAALKADLKTELARPATVKQ